LNPDGTLVVLAGSPFAVSGNLAAAGSFLVASSGSTVSALQVDPSSGALTQSGTGQVNGGGPITADATNVYVSGNIPGNNSTGIYGFAISGTGALTPLAGSPYTFSNACDMCDVPNALSLNNNFLIQGGIGFHSLGDFTVYARGAGGVLGPAQILGTDAQTSVTIQHPTGSFSYALDPTDFLLSEYTISPSGKATPGAQTFVNNAQQILVDNTNRFLLVLDTTGVVHVMSIDPGTGAMSQIGTSEAAGNGAFEISMDNTGRFVFVSQTANPNFAGSVNQLTVFTFDPGTGAMKKLQSYPQTGDPGRAVVISR
jgi:6-phosphogluconolactonase (cycloisomerase 2 family)